MPVDHDKAGQGASAFRAFLRGIPDDIAKAAEDGLPVVLRVDAPLPAHAQRLMDALGVPVEVVPVSEPAGDYVRRSRPMARSMGNYDPPTRNVRLVDGEAKPLKTAEQIREEELAWRESRPMTTSCAVDGCDWRHEGTVGECREVALEHRGAVHGVTQAGKLSKVDARKLGEAGAERRRQMHARAEDRPADPPRISTASQGDTLSTSEPHDPPVVDADDGPERAGPEAAAESSASGGATKPRESKWTRELVFDRLHTAVEELGRLPLSREYAEHGLPGPGPVTKVFGNWGNLCEEAGYPRPKRGSAPLAVESRRPKDSSSEGAVTDVPARGHARPVDARGLDDEQPAMRAPTPAATDATGEPEPRPAPNGAHSEIAYLDEAPPEPDRLAAVRTAALNAQRAIFALLDAVEAATTQEEPHA